METAVSAPGVATASWWRAIQRCSGPPFPLLPISVVLSAGAGAPRYFHGPAHVRRTVVPAGPVSAPPALTWSYVRVLPCLALHAVMRNPTALPSEPRHESRPCLTLGLLVGVVATSAVNARNISSHGENV